MHIYKNDISTIQLGNFNNSYHNLTQNHCSDSNPYFKPVNSGTNDQYGPNAAFSSSFSSESSEIRGPSPQKSVKTCTVPFPGANPNLFVPVPVVYQVKNTQSNNTVIQNTVVQKKLISL